MTDILTLARQVRDTLSGDDPQKRARVEMKRKQTERSALELRALVAPLAGHTARFGGEDGVLHVRADKRAAYVEFVPNEKYQASAKFDGRIVTEQRSRPGKMPTQRLTLAKDAEGYVVRGFNLPEKRAAQIEDFQRILAAIIGPLLE